MVAAVGRLLQAVVAGAVVAAILVLSPAVRLFPTQWALVRLAPLLVPMAAVVVRPRLVFQATRGSCLLLEVVGVLRRSLRGVLVTTVQAVPVADVQVTVAQPLRRGVVARGQTGVLAQQGLVGAVRVVTAVKLVHGPGVAGVGEIQV